MVQNKKAAIELSIGTIVVIVIAMSMLILGLVLVRNIFQGSTDNIQELNNKVKDQIKGLFQSDTERAVIKLTEDTATMKQGSNFGVAFGVSNIEQGATGSTEFKYQLKSDDSDIGTTCGITPVKALKWAQFGSGTMSIPAGQVETNRILFVIPEDAPLCTTKFRIIIWRPSKEDVDHPYADPFFFVKIVGKGLF